ncbi:MAG: znuB [Gammaproteobacteria bacterium]|jgi:zinc/manganese transport system permease protein|nr:znuB [Gammaproteobacteria bacterium]
MLLTTLVNFITEPFQYAFMRHAFSAGSLAAVLASMVGFFVVIRQLGFAAHALGHVGFAGACGAMLFGWAPIAGQLVITLLTGIFMGTLGRRLEERDTIIGITLAFALGSGVLFLHFLSAYSGQASSILFGNLLGVSSESIRWMLVLTIVGLLSLAVLARPLWFSSLTPMLAEAKGLSLNKVAILFFCVMAIAITIASQIVGVLLVFTLIVGPPAIALQWSRNFWPGISLCVVLSLVIVWVAVFLSYYTDWPISFCISALIFIFYVLSVIKNGRVFRR